MMENKPEGWLGTLDDLIRANSDYETANETLKKKYGNDGTLGGPDYRKRKNELLGGEKADEELGKLADRKRVKKSKPKPAWTKQKQTAADTSKLAQIINMGIYQGMLPLCANKELREEHVQEINPGGAIVANITYFFPESKLEHPIVMLGIRVVILYIKFKSVCGKMQRVTQIGKTKSESGGGGIKPGMKTELRK